MGSHEAAYRRQLYSLASALQEVRPDASLLIHAEGQCVLSIDDQITVLNIDATAALLNRVLDKRSESDDREDDV